MKNLIGKIVPRFGGTIVQQFDLPQLEHFKEHRRMKVFFNKGLNCVNCSRHGMYLIIREIRGEKHIEILAQDMIPMSVDHIFPKSKGGRYVLENLQPMCSVCNTKKSDKI